MSKLDNVTFWAIFKHSARVLNWLSSVKVLTEAFLQVIFFECIHAVYQRWLIKFKIGIFRKIATVNKKFQIQILRWIFKVNSFSSGKFSISGHILGLGVPNRSMIKSNWFISLLPGKSGLWARSSPKIQPAIFRKVNWINYTKS